MSTAILRGRRNGFDDAAQDWLMATELAGDADAALRLSRAIKPADYGFPKRTALDLTTCTDFETDLILLLLEAGQVPTPEAVATARINPPNMNCLEMRQERRREARQIDATIRNASDWLGEELSGVVALHWKTHGVGPTWQEVWHSSGVREWWIFELGEVPDYRTARKPMFTAMARLGWVAYNRTPRSLCTGRRFHTYGLDDRVSRASAATVGYLVARHIGIYRRVHDGTSPTWADLADIATDARGIPIFLDEDDVRGQRRWLETQGWIRIEGGQLRRGEQAKAETRRRAALRKQSSVRAM